ncbi:hypothetical protein OG874_13585 [Nocardia sp. NBC_00565]|uniref:hypothetical protein n=1 Tax=Nocardia sp. NBC_00565 TaxID=2975993 RepID=UPI002E7FC75C|nr:hypothetical protein [Nocardia sp. NBC_00565]WUC06100.1 hypothetical protein OG874_13585 [Nocardia sp. NBC_00565]
MTVTDDYSSNNTRYAQQFTGPLPLRLVARHCRIGVTTWRSHEWVSGLGDIAALISIDAANKSRKSEDLC